MRVGAGALGTLIDDLAAEPPGLPLAVVADDRVARLYAGELVERLRGRGLPATLLTFPEGESSKVRQVKQDLEDRLFDLGLGRDGAVVAVGGGVTGDLAGFLAATWQRGVPVVQVPTTLLAMVDASVGGKTGVDLPGGKNLVGAFHQPWGIYADTTVLDTLEPEIYREGFAEVIKGAVVADARLFRRLESEAEALLARDPTLLAEVVGRSIEFKARVVTGDERESGRRAALNFGHTVAHALETVSGYGMRHGLAVARGMQVEARLAREATGFPERHAARLEALVGAFDLPTRLPAATALDAVVRATGADKKRRAGETRYALPRRIGAMPPLDRLTSTVDEARLRDALREALER